MGAMPQPSAADIVRGNLSMRQALLASAPRFRKNLGTFNGAVGGNTRIKLFNVGLITKLQAFVSIPVTIGTATATISKRGPYNAFTRVRVTDYQGTDRVNASGYQLWVLDSVRQAYPFGLNNLSAGNTVITNPNVPTAVGNGTVQFVLDIPLAFDPENDLRGAIIGQTAIGDIYASFDWINSLISTGGDIDSLYSGAGTTTVVTNGTPTITLFQDFLMPQPLKALGGQVPIPVLDTQTVYECNGVVRSGDNLAVNTEKLINYPNARTVVGAYYNFINGGTYGATDLNGIRLIANGNNVIREDTQLSKQFEQRQYLAGDLQTGTYWNLHRNRPIEIAQFGNLQIGLTPGTINASPTAANLSIEFLFESFYTQGAVLPGMNQG